MSSKPIFSIQLDAPLYKTVLSYHRNVKMIVRCAATSLFLNILLKKQIAATQNIKLKITIPADHKN